MKDPDIEIIETNTLRPKLVHIWSFQVWMPMSLNITIALIIRQNQDDVGLFGKAGEKTCKKTKK